MRYIGGVRRSWTLAIAASVACSPAIEEPQLAPPPPRASEVAPPSIAPPPTDPVPAATDAPSSSGPCPDDMVFVDAVHCPDTQSFEVGLTCLHEEHEGSNNLTICHEFAPGQRCHVPKRRQRFCIDRYEHPSRKGAHPPVMVSAYDAAGLCAEQGKRMCFDSEWTAACEGPELEPFPYGYKRSKEHCNIDNPFIGPHLSRVHSHDESERGPELMRLDQSKPSGAMEGCKSDFGVYDLTGNFDEWVLTEWPQGKSKWTGLKGGAWGHVRNRCRPMTTSHVAHWSYYFISFRCCKEPDATRLEPPPADGPPLWKPPPWSPPSHPAGIAVDRGWTPASR